MNTQANFVTKVSSGGRALEYSTYVDATPDGYSGASYTAIAVDGSGDAYIVGSTSSPNFPVTANAFQMEFGGGSTPSWSDAYLVELNPQGSVPLYSSYLGGPGEDVCTAIALDPAGDVYVAGYVGGSGNGNPPDYNFPTTPFAYQTHYGGGDLIFSLASFH